MHQAPRGRLGHQVKVEDVATLEDGFINFLKYYQLITVASTTLPL